GDSRVITAVMNNSGAFDHVTAAKVSKEKTIAIVYGEGGMERPNAEGDYNGIQPGGVPACLLKMTGGQGNECQNGECGWGHGSGPWGGMAATVAWMRWHLGGEDFRQKDFVGTSGAYINGPIVGERGNWKGQCKNF
ncbi:MAG: alpha/beta hydrolase, partial [Fibrobacter sp.]|nr:alpha/beta hydrolase [Fibrobacter sp.]